MIKTLFKGIIEKVSTNKLRATLIAIALVAVMLATMFPVHIEMGNPGNAVFNIGTGHFRIVIGNQVNAQAANYTCDGVNDDVEFQTALNALPEIGGELFILAGAYSFNATVTRAIDNVSVIGVGAAVLINNDGLTPLFTAGGDRWVFSNLRTDNGGLTMTGTDYWMWLNIFIGTVFYSVEAPDDPLGGVVATLDDVGDVDVPGPTDQYILYWNDGNSAWECQTISNYDLADLGVKELDDLDDLDVGSPTDQYLLFWDNGDSAWEAQALSNYDLADLGTKELDDLDDLDVGSPSDGYIVFWDNGDSAWECQSISNWDLTDLGTKNFDDLDDVNVPTPSDGYLVAWNASGSEWVCVPLSDYDLSDLGTKELNDLDDVNTTETDGWYIYWNAGNSKWESKALAIADIPGLQDILTGISSNVTDLQGDVSDLAGDLSDHEAATDVHGVWMDYQGRRIALVNPYQAAANRYKVQLHGHTTGSDGVDTPTQYMTAYKNAGYDAAAITDHDVLTADPAVGGILYIPGVEESSYGMHIVNDFASVETAEIESQEVIDDILLDGGVPDIAHSWYAAIPVSINRMEELLGYQVMEIANAKIGQLGGANTDETRWDAVLTMGKNVWAIGVDDSHNVSDSAQFNKFYVEIMADTLSLVSLQESLVAGNFYVRQNGGPELTVTLSGNNVTCSSAAAMDIEFIGRDGLVLFTEDNVTTSTYSIVGWEQYVRVRAVDHATGTYYAWSQPTWILTPTTVPDRQDDEAVWIDAPTIAMQDLNRTSTSDWTDLDLTAYTSAGAKIAIIKMSFHTDTLGAAGTCAFAIRKNGTTPSAFPVVSYAYNQVVAPGWYFTYAFVGMDTGQVVEYQISNTAWTGWQVDCYLEVLGYIE